MINIQQKCGSVRSRPLVQIWAVAEYYSWWYTWGELSFVEIFGSSHCRQQVLAAHSGIK